MIVYISLFIIGCIQSGHSTLPSKLYERSFDGMYFCFSFSSSFTSSKIGIKKLRILSSDQSLNGFSVMSYTSYGAFFFNYCASLSVRNDVKIMESKEIGRISFLIFFYIYFLKIQ